ncbi:MAG: hypothetical protein ACYC91_18120 [Solirubrobacteraceae bacterium]
MTTPGRPSIQDDHYPPKPPGALERRPRAHSQDEKQFLQIGAGAERWLRRAAAEGTPRLRRKLVEAVDLSKLHGVEPVNRALESYAIAGRFADGDLVRVLAHHHQRDGGEVVAFPVRGEDSSLQASTKAWEGFGA